METEVILNEFKKTNDAISELATTVDQLKLILQTIAKIVLSDDRAAKCIANSQLPTQEELDKQIIARETAEIEAAKLEMQKFDCLIPAQAPFECLEKE